MKGPFRETATTARALCARLLRRATRRRGRPGADPHPVYVDPAFVDKLRSTRVAVSDLERGVGSYDRAVSDIYHGRYGRPVYDFDDDHTAEFKRRAVDDLG